MTIQQTIEIPAGSTILTFTPASESPAADSFADLRAYLRANTPTTIEEAKKEAERKFNDPSHKNFFDRHFGALKGAFGDGMEYQRKMRDEWD
jgi:ABC-type dipeptide/oligopeptide/nickel transport system permease component